MSEIVKIQVSLSEPTAPYLVYAEGRKHVRFVDQTPELVAAMAEKPKAFFQAEWVNGTWIIGKRVADKSW